MGNAELQVFLLPHPAPAIGAGEREAPRVAVLAPPPCQSALSNSITLPAGMVAVTAS